MNVNLFNEVINGMGFIHVTYGNVIMWMIGLTFILLAIIKNYEPLLLVPIGFGMIIVNIPLTDMMKENGLLWVFYHFAIDKWDILPPLIFLGIGALTDFSPMIAAPKTLLLGAAAQLGVYATFFGSLLLGFNLTEAASIGIIGGADGPTTIFLTSKLAPHLLGATTVAAYSYMAMVPIIQPPIMRLLTTREERLIKMRTLRRVSKAERVGFALVASLIVCFLVPAAAPLASMLFLGNLFRECGVVERLTKTAQNELINIVTIFLGVCVGATMPAEVFLRPQSLYIFCLGLLAFSLSTAGGILLAKFMNLFLREKINPLIGAAGVSAVPMAARVAQVVARRENKHNYILMHAMGPNVAGVIGTAAAAGLFLSMLK
jgi:sodium ion-translocating decarboxylase beta subunit